VIFHDLGRPLKVIAATLTL